MKQSKKPATRLNHTKQASSMTLNGNVRYCRSRY